MKLPDVLAVSHDRDVRGNPDDVVSYKTTVSVIELRRRSLR